MIDAGQLEAEGGGIGAGGEFDFEQGGVAVEDGGPELAVGFIVRIGEVAVGGGSARGADAQALRPRASGNG